MGKINLNADEEIIKKLERICKATERNKTQMVIFLIKEEYKRLYGDE